MEDNKTKVISEIINIIEYCRYNAELVEGYKAAILDQVNVHIPRWAMERLEGKPSGFKDI